MWELKNNSFSKKKKKELKQIKEDGSKASHMVKIGGKKERNEVPWSLENKVGSKKSYSRC